MAMTALIQAPIFRRTTWVVCLFALMTAVSSPTATAQDKGNREREALRRAQASLRSTQEQAASLQQEKASLLAEKEALIKDKQSVGAESQRHASRVAAAQAQARDAQSKAQSLEAELEQLRTQLTSAKELVNRQAAEIADNQRTTRAVRALLESSQQKQRVLEQRNAQLYEVGLAAVEMYRSRKPAETAARQAGVLGFGIVDVENISEQWLDRLNAARFLDQDKLTP